MQSTETDAGKLKATRMMRKWKNWEGPLWPLASGLHSSSARVLGFPVYGDSPKWVGLLAHKILRPASDAIDWLTYRLVPEHKYHLVDTKLDPGYYDHDTRMLHACFALLGEYLQEEGGIEAIRSNGGTRHVIADPYRAELITLWEWWTVGKPADEKQRDAWMATLFGGKHRGFKTKPVEGSDKLEEWVGPTWDTEEEKLHERFRALEDKIDADEQAMLHRLIDIRRNLWT